MAASWLDPTALVEAHPLMRAVEREGGNLHSKALAGRRLHLVAADHDAGGRAEGRGAGVLEGLAWCQHRLLADDTRTAHLLHAAEPVGDVPMTSAQLHRLL